MRRRGVIGSIWAVVVAAVAVAGIAAVAGCGGDAGSLTVFGASSLVEPLERYDRAFGAGGVRGSFAGSDQLAAQIRQGAPADVFASADTEYPAQLHREGLAEKPVVFARNRLVVVAARGGPVGSLRDLARPGTKLVVGERSVPVGRYTREMLRRLPRDQRAAILAGVRSEEPEVSSVLAKVVGGAADAGIVYATDARTVAREVTTIPIPLRLQPPIAYGAVVLTGSGERGLARRYVAGLVRGRGAAELRRAGFLPPG